MTLTIAVAYNGRDEIVDAVRALRTEHAERGLAIAEAIPEITVTTVTERIHPPPQQKFTEIWIGLDRSTAWLPKPVKWREWPRREFARLYFPNAEPREIDNVQVVPRIHQSVIDRMNALADYRPENFPASFDIEPNSSQRRRA